MKYIRHQECVFEVDGNKFLATSANLTAQSSAQDNRTYRGGLLSYEATEPLNATIDVEYYITGKEDLIGSLTGEASCNGKFCGIHFSGACLTSYSVNIEPYKPVSFSASFSIYSGYHQETQTGSFVGSTSGLANGAFTELKNFNKNNIGIDFPQKISYNVESERLPNYIIGHEYPQYVTLGKVNRGISIQGENIGPLIDFSGRDFATIKISPKNRGKIARGQTVECAGRIVSQNLTISKDSLMKGSVDIIESLR